MSYVFETPRLRFRPMTEADAVLQPELINSGSKIHNSVRELLPYTLMLCPQGSNLPLGYASLLPMGREDLQLAVRVELFTPNPALWHEAVKFFVRFVPHRFGITEVIMLTENCPPGTDLPSCGFVRRDGLYVCSCGWRVPVRENLTDGNLRLVCKRITPPDVERGWIASADFDLFCDENRVGCCGLRLGYNEQLFYGGQVSYTVFPDYRGHGYAAAASELLFQYAVRYGMPMLSITCVPENTASRRTAERAGFTCEGEYPIPRDLPIYAEKRSICRRYVRHSE